MRILSVFLLFSLVGCDSSKNDTGQQLNNKPVANAGADMSQPADRIVQLDGHGSYDPDGDSLIYHWEFEHVPEGSVIESREAPFSVNHSASAASPTFSPDIVGTYIVALTVSDGKQSSTPDYAVIVAEESESTPIANAGNDQTVNLGDSVSLNGSQSYDPLGKTLTYLWTLVDQPEDSSASLTTTTEVTTNLVPDEKGVYVVNLVVNNGLVNSQPDAVVVTVTADNGAPTANAGEDKDAEDCTYLKLDASGSADPDDDDLTYFWSLQSVPTASAATSNDFSDQTIVNPTFWADVSGQYIFSVAVKDGTDWSTPDLVTYTVSERSYNTAPSVDAGATKTETPSEVACVVEGYGYDCDDCDDVYIKLGDDASISDADSDPYTYYWEVIEGDATISDVNSLSTNVTLTNAEASTPGSCDDNDYVFKLTAIDCTGAEKSDNVTYTVSCCGASAK